MRVVAWIDSGVDASSTTFAKRDILTIPRKGPEILNGLDERDIYILSSF
jgi:hypothetical protein